MQNPEQEARADIDRLLRAAGWSVQDYRAADLSAGRGVALREFELASGFGTADYLLYVGGKACGVIEAKKRGATLTGVELQSGKYSQGLPESLPACRRPMLSARNVDHGRINFDEFRYISNESFEAEHGRTRVAPSNVLLTIVGTIGRSAVVPEAAEPFALERSVAVLSPKDGLLPKFLS